MNRFIRPVSFIALLQEVVIFSCLIVVIALLRAFEKVYQGRPRAPLGLGDLLRNYWFVIALIPLIWVALAALDENSEDPRLEERDHFWIGVGLLILLTLFGLMAIFNVMIAFQRW